MKYFRKYPAESGCDAGSKQARAILIGVGVVTGMEISAGAFPCRSFHRNVPKNSCRSMTGVFVETAHLYRLHVFCQQLMVGAVLFQMLRPGEVTSTGIPPRFRTSSMYLRRLTGYSLSASRWGSFWSLWPNWNRQKSPGRRNRFTMSIRGLPGGRFPSSARSVPGFPRRFCRLRTPEAPGPRRRSRHPEDKGFPRPGL